MTLDLLLFLWCHFVSQIRCYYNIREGLSWWLRGKESAVQEIQEMQVQSLGWENSLEQGMAAHSSILAWENPMDRGAWRATVHRVVRVGHD